MKLVYEVGLADLDEDGVMADHWRWLQGLGEASPEKHEMTAFLLMMAVRKEWAEAEHCRRLQNLRAARRATKGAGDGG